jgi:6-pyruvoyltetrahydropterin/6-carboxytetrahydropterin synthase
MQTKVGVEFEIDFAHTLKGHLKCGKPHGHTAKIIVEAAGELKNGSTYEDNMVIEFDEMKRICWETLQRLDHTNLDVMFDFPTSENIAMWIFEELKDKIPIYGVKFFEGSNKYCEITKNTV